MTDEEKKALERIEDFLTTNIIISISSDETANAEVLKAFISKNEYLSIEFIASMFLKQFKEIEELKASHITTNNKATNTEKAKIFDVIENSIDTYIEKSKPYWEQIMTKDEMTIEEALTIIDDMYQDRYKIMSQKTEKETIVDLSKMDYIKFTNLEWASVRVLREVQSLNHKFKKLEDKIKAKIEEYEKELNKLLQKEEWLEPHDTIKRNKYMHYIEFGQSLLEKED